MGAVTIAPRFIRKNGATVMMLAVVAAISATG